MMMKIKYKRMIQTAPLEGVHLELEIDVEPGVPQNDVREIAQEIIDSQIDPWERHIREHYLKRPENRVYRGRPGDVPEKRKPTDNSGRRVHQETVVFMIGIKKDDFPAYLKLNGIAHAKGLHDATFWTLEEAKAEYEKLKNRRG